MIYSILFKLRVRDALKENGMRTTRIISVIAPSLQKAKDTYYEKSRMFECGVEDIVDVYVATKEDKDTATHVYEGT